MNQEHIRILLVEDDDVDRIAIERMVNKKGLPYDLVTVSTVTEAIAHLQQSTFDVALLDHKLSDGDGLEIQAQTGETPTVFITGTADRATAVQAMKAGAYDFLIKDNDREYLQLLPTVIQTTLERRRAQDQMMLQKHMIDSLGEMVLLLDENGDVVFANAAVERVLGYTPGDVMGSAWWELAVPDATQRHEMRAQAATRARGKESPTSFDLELPHRDGNRIWVAWTESRGPNGGLICVGRDVTECKQAQIALQETHDELECQVKERTCELSQTNEALREEIVERKLAEVALRRREKQLVEAQRIARLGNWEWDIASSTVTGSDELYRVFGTSPEQFRQSGLKGFLDCIHPEDRTRVDEAVQKAIDDRTSLSVEYRIVHPDGVVRYIHSQGEIVCDKASRPTTIVGTSQDITEHKQAEHALRASEERYRNLVHSLQEGIWAIDQDACTTFVNPRMAEMLGYTVDEMQGKHLFEFMDERGVEIATRQLERRRQGIQEQHDFEFLRQDGTRIYTSLETTPLTNDDGDYVGALAGVMDITERRQAVEALRENQANLSALIENTDGRIWAVDTDYRLIVSNSLFRENIQTGLGRDITPGESVLCEGIPDTVQDEWCSYYDRALQGERFIVETETRFGARPGWMEYRLNPIKTNDGSIVGVTVYGRDITERKQAEQALKESGEKLRTLFDLLPVGVSILDDQRQIVLQNPALRRIVSLSQQDLIAKRYEKRTHLRSDGSPMPPEEFPSVRAVQEQIIIQDVEIGIPTESGQLLWTNVSAVPVDFSDWNVIITTSDITKRKRMEEQIRASLHEKEVMLAEIHHRVKNNLQVVSSLLNFQADYAQDERAIEALRDSQHRIYSMALIHEQLYQSPDLAQVDFASYIQTLTADLFAAYRPHLAHSITLQLDVHNVALEIKQAIPCGLLINELISNAFKYAFPAESNKPGYEIYVSLVPGDGETCELTVGDNGVGLPSGFKPSGQGTLGMFLIDTFVQQLGGTIEWQNENGTTCRVVFAKL